MSIDKMYRHMLMKSNSLTIHTITFSDANIKCTCKVKHLL